MEGTMIGDLPAKILARCPDAQEAFITLRGGPCTFRKGQGSSRNFQQRRPGYIRRSQPIASAKTLPVLDGDSTPQKEGTASEASLRVASCQFPVSADVAGNAQWIRKYMHQAKTRGAHLLHTSEASLSGYAGVDFATFDDFDWDLLRHETTALCRLARELELWLVLGSGTLSGRKDQTHQLFVSDQPIWKGGGSV